MRGPSISCCPCDTELADERAVPPRLAGYVQDVRNHSRLYAKVLEEAPKKRMPGQIVASGRSGPARGT